MRGGTSMEWRFNSIEPYIVSQGNIYDLFESIYFKLICRNLASILCVPIIHNVFHRDSSLKDLQGLLNFMRAKEAILS